MRVLIAALLLLASVTPAAAADPVIEPVGETSWYLAIGDSLAAGYQPIGDPANDHMTRAGYPDQLWLMARGQYPDLQLLNLACPGEDTATIRLDNGRCAYGHGSQLDEALAFIDEHRDRLAFITIDIGFNDFECSDDLLCVFTGIRNIEQRLPAILADLRAAAPDTPIVGMNIYDPFLTFWLDEQTRVLAGQSVVAMQMVNEALGEVYAAAGIPVADVETAFAMDDWRSLVPMAGFGEVPRNLALLCERTWQCHPPPLGPDRHPNVLGFRVMAEAFARELGLEPVGIDAGSSPVG
ncbi:MAG TPA: SGNH/GDSL hydrolase family protein [Anaerolineae bacterium]|nr:SGNH/GDSL hydrolase family protein [Anaerolineae bacterium]